MPKVTSSDLFAVIVCGITPAISVLVLLAIVAIENLTVKALGGDGKEKRLAQNRQALRTKVKTFVNLLLQTASVCILLKMIQLMAVEVLEIISDAQETREQFIPVVSCVVVGGLAAMVLVWVAEGKETETSVQGRDKVNTESSKSSRGVIFAMLLHTCAEGLAAGIVMSSSDDTNGGGELTSMFDITSAYFISLALHNICEGLVVATAVRTELEEKTTLESANLSWIVSASVSSTLSHIGQPLGLMAILYADQLGLAALTGQPLFVSFIQGVSLGSISGAVLLESIPEFFEAGTEFITSYRKPPRFSHSIVSHSH